MLEGSVKTGIANESVTLTPLRTVSWPLNIIKPADDKEISTVPPPESADMAVMTVRLVLGL